MPGSTLVRMFTDYFRKDIETTLAEERKVSKSKLAVDV